MTAKRWTMLSCFYFHFRLLPVCDRMFPCGLPAWAAMKAAIAATSNPEMLEWHPPTVAAWLRGY